MGSRGTIATILDRCANAGHTLLQNRVPRTRSGPAALRITRSEPAQAPGVREVPIVTLAEGEINGHHIGLKETMNALFLKDHSAKTYRCNQGRVEKGKAGGGRSYRYAVV